MVEKMVTQIMKQDLHKEVLLVSIHWIRHTGTSSFTQSPLVPVNEVSTHGLWMADPVLLSLDPLNSDRRPGGIKLLLHHWARLLVHSSTKQIP